MTRPLTWSLLQVVGSLPVVLRKCSRRMNFSGRLTEASAGVATLVLASGTLLCCALPILLVTLGMGASVAALISAAPWLVTLSHYKGWMFAISAAGLIAAAFFLYRPGRTCPTDPRLAQFCATADRWNRRVLMLAAVVWTIGAFAAFLLLPLRQLLDR